MSGISTLQGAQSAIRNPPKTRPCCNRPQFRNPPCVKCNIASGVRSWNCTGPGTAPKLVHAAPE
eukprot:15446607-Alexandrium_andersonii.AAC.1